MSIAVPHKKASAPNNTPTTTTPASPHTTSSSARSRSTLTTSHSTCKLSSAILSQYERECARDARYVEAEMAKHKIDELKAISLKVEKEKALNAHLREKVDVEEAYLNEFNDFQQRWEQKLLKFEEKVEGSRGEMLENQKAQLMDAFNMIEKKYSLASKEVNNKVLNLQKVEQSLAQQKRYIEAQRVREEWRKEQELIAIQQKQEIDKKKNEIMSEYERKNKKEVHEFVTKINEMRINLENERKKELDKLIAKYEKIKKQLNQIQDSESKKVMNNKAYVAPNVSNNGSAVKDGSVTGGNLLHSKKKVLMNKIKKLDLTQEIRH